MVILPIDFRSLLWYNIIVRTAKPMNERKHKMTRQEQKKKLEELQAYWAKQIGEAKEANDPEALREAKANHEHTTTELLKLQPNPKD